MHRVCVCVCVTDTTGAWQPVHELLIAVVTDKATNNESLFTWQTTKSGTVCVCVITDIIQLYDECKYRSGQVADWLTGT